MTRDTEEAFAKLDEAYRLIEKCRKDVATLGLIASNLSWDAKDGFNGADDHLSDAESEIGAAIEAMKRDNPEPDEHDEHRQSYYRNQGVGRSAA